VSRVIEVRVPDMGNFKDVAVIDVLVKPGDTIEPETPLVTLETEKATMDVPSTVAGVVERVVVAKGGKVNPGDVVVAVRSEEGTAAREPPPSEKPAEARTPGSGQTPAPTSEARGASGAGPQAAPSQARAPGAAAEPPRPAPAAPSERSLAATRGQPSTPGLFAPPLELGFSRAHASPSVRRFARELGVDLGAVSGTGFKARITHDDVKAFVKKTLTETGTGAGRASAAGARGTGLPSIPPVDFTQFGPTEVKALSRIQRISAARLHASWVNLPHVTQFDEADITELEQARAAHKDRANALGIKLTPLAFILRACVKALQEFPQFNASLDPSGENLILKKYLHLGFAADTPQGLLVPVVRDADRKDVYELARVAGELAEKARAGTLTLAQMQGGCFTISSLGGIGGTAFTPIINAPEVAILGVSRAAQRPVYSGGGFVPRLILPLSLSYDHRVIDGALAVRFTTFLARTLADVGGLLEAVP
jgi:pyruvate dehydrogenase E2 component (dihydrolipoamide acetyltransferase)